MGRFKQDGGLITAIRHFAEDQALEEGTLDPADDGVRFTVKGPESLPPLSAAVEVAAYRIVLEAMTNVVRHARARSCVVELAVLGESEILRPIGHPATAYDLHPLNEGTAGRSVLCITICDDGLGLACQPTGTGLGLPSMRERAAELGGCCTIKPGEAGGTRVAAFLPIAAARVEVLR